MIILRRNHILLVIAIIAVTTGAIVRSCQWPPCMAAAFSPSLNNCAYHDSHFATSRAITTTSTRDDATTSSTPLPFPFTFRLSAEAIPSLSDTNINNNSNDAATNTNTLLLPPPNEMKLNEIKAELNALNTSFTDCFDRESLEKRLSEARRMEDDNGVPLPNREEEEEVVEDDDAKDTPVSSSVDSATIRSTTSTESTTTTTVTTTPTTTDFDRHSTLAQLRSLRVKELKIQLSELKVRWGTMIEKEELVQALCNALEARYHASKNFSRSGRLVPGQVADVDDESVLLQELGWLEQSDNIKSGVMTPTRQPSSSSMEKQTLSSHASPILLLDVYATWCGPCKFLAPILAQVAEEVGPTVRVMKLDSDKYPRLSSVLKVGGLPTLILFDGGDVSKEIHRVEGALSKDQLIDFVNGNFNR